MAPLTACSISASANTMFGALPPSSSDTFVRFLKLPGNYLANFCRTRERDFVDAGEQPMPHRVSPKPGTMLTTPSGKPASWIACPAPWLWTGVCSAV